MGMKQRLGSVAIAGLAFAAALGLPGIAVAQMQDLKGVTLRVGTFGGPWRDDQQKIIVPKFEAMGAKVEFVIASPQDNLAKLVAARGRAAPFDVMEILDATLDQMIEGGMLEKLHLVQIPNRQHLESWQHNEWVVANWTTQEVICYHKDKYKELGLEAPKTYTDLANAKLAGRVMIPDITSGGGLANFAGITYAAGGDVKNVKPGLDLITSLKSLKFWKFGGDTTTAFGSGDIYASIAHAGWCLRSKNAGNNVTSVHPVINAQQTGVIKLGWMGIIKGTKSAAAANMYLNEFLDREFQVAFAKNSGVMPVNRLAIQDAGKDPVFAEMSKLDSASMGKMLRIDYKGVNVSDWYDQWNRSVAK